MKVRVKFSKYGTLRYIGHLDVMRFFQKALRRAKLDVAYTGGYSPHQIMSFASPLGIGMSSMGEYMDIEINSHQGSIHFQEALQTVCPEGISILSVKALPEKAQNAMASVAAASYAVAYKKEGKSFEGLQPQITAYMQQVEILISKEGKKGSVQKNIRPGILDFHIEDGMLLFMLEAGSENNIRPSYVTDTFFSFAQIHSCENQADLRFIRLEIYTNIGNAAHPVLVPLEEIGETF